MDATPQHDHPAATTETGDGGRDLTWVIIVISSIVISHALVFGALIAGTRWLERSNYEVAGAFAALVTMVAVPLFAVRGGWWILKAVREYRKAAP